MDPVSAYISASMVESSSTKNREEDFENLTSREKEERLSFFQRSELFKLSSKED